MSLPPPPPSQDAHGQTGALVCYRHPNREAGRRCTRCGKPACADCLVQATIGSHCLDCAKAARPDMRTRARFWNARQPVMATMTIIVLNVAVFVYLTVRDPASLSGRGVTLGQAQLGLFREALEGRPILVGVFDGQQYVSQGDDWYRLLTSGFVHFGIVHILFNMYLLYMLGQMLEPALGRIRFLLVYLAGLLGGSAGVVLLNQGAVAGGASGAVFGLMGLAFVGYYLNGANPLNTSIGSLLLMNLFITFLFPRISIGGHLGGAAAGALCALAVMAPRHKRLPTWSTFAAPLGVAALSVVVAAISVT